jgi:MerR family transcriptional regulator/heat shock protein HspR
LTPLPRPFDNDHAALYTVGQVSHMLGVQPAFLRRLDAEEVVQPARSDGGQRRYSAVEILRVEKVVTLTGEGLTLAGVRRLLLLEAQVRELQLQLIRKRGSGARSPGRAPAKGENVDPDEMTHEQLASIRARLGEPPPPLALAERKGGQTALAEYLARLQEDRIALVDEVDRLRAEIGQTDADEGRRGTGGRPQGSPEGSP